MKPFQVLYENTWMLIQRKWLFQHHFRMNCGLFRFQAGSYTFGISAKCIVIQELVRFMLLIGSTSVLLCFSLFFSMNMFVPVCLSALMNIGFTFRPPEPLSSFFSNIPPVLTTGASPFGIGAVRAQDHRPVIFISLRSGTAELGYLKTSWDFSYLLSSQRSTEVIVWFKVIGCFWSWCYRKHPYCNPRKCPPSNFEPAVDKFHQSIR